MMGLDSKSESLLDLPTELVNQIFENLDEQSLLRCKSVSRSILTLIEESISLKYRIELYAANLLDNFDSPLSKSARLRMLEAHQRAWTEGSWSSSTKISLASPVPLRAWELTGSTFGLAGDHNIRFIQLPSPLRGIEKHEWELEGFDFRIRDFATDRCQDLLVLLERETIATGTHELLHIHFRSMSTGLRHPGALQEKITHRIGLLDSDPDWYAVHICGDRIAVMVQAIEASEFHPPLSFGVSELAIWDWKSGSSKALLAGPIRAFSFLTENLMLLGMCWLHAIDPISKSETISLDVVDINYIPFNFKLPEALSTTGSRWSRSCNKWWSFQLPSFGRREDPLRPCLSIRTECSSPSEFTYGKNAPFTTSWNDRIYVITITSIMPYPELMLFIHCSALLSFCGRTPPTHIFSWEEWGPTHTRMVPGRISDMWFCYVHGLKVVITPDEDPSDIEVWDFHQPTVRRRIARAYDKEHQTINVADSARYNDVEDGIRLFEKDVVTSLPYSISTFKNPSPDYDEYMISEDCLVVVMDDEDMMEIVSF